MRNICGRKRIEKKKIQVEEKGVALQEKRVEDLRFDFFLFLQKFV